jgi:hypothetical protein
MNIWNVYPMRQCQIILGYTRDLPISVPIIRRRKSIMRITQKCIVNLTFLLLLLPTSMM